VEKEPERTLFNTRELFNETKMLPKITIRRNVWDAHKTTQVKGNLPEILSATETNSTVEESVTDGRRKALTSGAGMKLEEE